MEKFQDQVEAFWDIKNNPTEYLPEKSLSLFQAFWIGYEFRYRAEFKNRKTFDIFDGFHEFVQKKFRVPSHRGSYGIATLYSRSESEAFDLWFSCLDEFIGKKPERAVVVEETNIAASVSGFFSFFEIVIKRTPMYVGVNSFTLARTMIAGWFRAGRDFGLAESDQEGIFKNFENYIEERPFWLRSGNAPDLPPNPSWHKVIWAWTAHISIEEKALEMFLNYFDEFGLQGKGYIDYVEFHWQVHNERVRR